MLNNTYSFLANNLENMRMAVYQAEKPIDISLQKTQKTYTFAKKHFPLFVKSLVIIHATAFAHFITFLANVKPYSPSYFDTTMSTTMAIASVASSFYMIGCSIVVVWHYINLPRIIKIAPPPLDEINLVDLQKQSDEILQRLTTLLEAHHSAESPVVQALIHNHYTRSGKTIETYLNYGNAIPEGYMEFQETRPEFLNGQTRYVVGDKIRKRFEVFHPDMPAFMAKAITIYCERQNLLATHQTLAKLLEKGHLPPSLEVQDLIATYYNRLDKSFVMTKDSYLQYGQFIQNSGRYEFPERKSDAFLDGTEQFLIETKLREHFAPNSELSKLMADAIAIYCSPN